MEQIAERIIEYIKKLMLYFKPDEHVPALDTIDFQDLSNQGKKYLLLDLDETLLPKELNDITPGVYTFVARLKFQGFKICLTSNSRHPMRVEYIGKTLEIPYISFSFKPLPFAFKKAMKLLKATKEETVVIGDQLLTDILGGNMLGLYTIYVDPLSKTESVFMWLMRIIEKKLFEFNSKSEEPVL